jgi:hypothetical protein
MPATLLLSATSSPRPYGFLDLRTALFYSLTAARHGHFCDNLSALTAPTYVYYLGLLVNLASIRVQLIN